MTAGRPRAADPKGHSPAAPMVVVERDAIELPAVVPEPPTRYVRNDETKELEPRQLADLALMAWDRFWLSPVVVALDAIDGVDRLVLERWVCAIDELDEIDRGLAATGRIVAGSMGQPVLNPLYTVRRDVLAELKRYEEVLGLTPRDRAKLGIEFGEAQMTAEKLNETLDKAAQRRERQARSRAASRKR